MIMAEHARTFGASGFERLMLCPGSAVLTADAPRTSSAYAAEGTAIHEAAAAVLLGGTWPLQGYKVTADGHSFVWDAEMEEVGQAYVDYVQGLPADFMFVEQRVAFGPAIGVTDPEDGFGTADAIVGIGAVLVVIDLKCGRGVDVQPEGNPQLMLYAIGALAELQGLAGDFDRVRLVIVQPRAGGVKKHVITVAELELWAKSHALDAVTQVQRAIRDGNDPHASAQGWGEAYLNPGEKQCKFCAAKATCPALREEVALTVAGQGAAPATPDDFADLLPHPAPDEAPHWLAACLSKVDLIEDWCKAVRAESERRLVAGEPVPGFKLVQGKKGNRQWVDATEVEKTFKETFRLKVEEMYDLNLISPTSAEKLAKAKVIGPRQWAKVTGLITQSKGKPHVAPETDPRPAITVGAVADDFDSADDLV